MRKVIKKNKLSLLLLALAALALAASFQACRARTATPQELQDFDAKIKVLQKKLEVYPPAVNSRGELTALEQEWRGTVGVLEEALKRAPKDAEVLWRLGECYRLGHHLDLEGAWPRAENYLKRSLELNPTVRAHVALGRLYVNSRPELAPAAEKQFKAALAVSTGPVPGAHNGLFFAYFYQGKFDEAMREADIYLELIPNHEGFKKSRDMALEAIRRTKEKGKASAGKK